MIQLVLYTTAHCHLCEQAETLLTDLATQYAISWEAIEISGDDSLLEKYGTRIPVIKHKNNHNEINWPFNSGDIANLITQP